MALYKKIETTTGVVFSYHRVCTVTIITNQQNIIEVSSYISKEKRDIEKEVIEKGEEYDVLINTDYIVATYDPDMTVISAYDYLKTLPDFKDATDIIEEEVTKDD